MRAATPPDERKMAMKSTTGRGIWALALVVALLAMCPAFAVADEAPLPLAAEEVLPEGAVPEEDAPDDDGMVAVDPSVDETEGAGEDISLSGDVGDVAPEGDAAEPLGGARYSGEWGGCTWTIDSEGLLSVFPTDGVSGQLANSLGLSSSVTLSYFPWYEYGASIRSVSFADGALLPSNCSGMFAGCSSLKTLDLSDWDTTSVTSMSRMFYGCSSLSTLDISGWDTSSVINMYGVFYLCENLSSLDVSEWDTSSVTDMSHMFYLCENLSSLDVSEWDTSSVTDMSYMFCDCSKLTSLDVSGWDTYHVTKMSAMFDGCSSLSSLDPSTWNTSSVKYMGYMFSCCSELTSLDLSSWDTTSVREMRRMFFDCSKLAFVDISGWDTSSVGDMGYSKGMFEGCSSLATIKVGNKYDTSGAFPEAVAGNGQWWSFKNKAWYTVSQIRANRNRTADTYYVIPPASQVSLIPIYRMYNTKTSEHLWTKSKKEYDSCGTGNYKDWRQENVAWYSPNLPTPASYAKSTQGDYVYVYRLYDKGRTGDHIYLTYGAEMKSYLSNGWVVDKGAGFWTLKKGATISGKKTIPIYRAYNPKLKRGKHHYTPSKTEYDTICKKHGWKPEGTKFYVVKK